MTSIRSRARLVYIALALGSFTDLLFYGQRLGISIPLFVLLILAAIFALGKLEAVPTARANLWVLLPLGFFSAMVAVRANPTLTMLNVLAVLALLSLVVNFYAAGRVERLGLLDYPSMLARTLKNSIARMGPVALEVARDTSEDRRRLRFLAPVLRGLFIALPILFLFTFLLSSADSIFEGFVNRLMDARTVEELPQIMWRLTVILFAAWVIAGALLYTLSRGQQAAVNAGYRQSFVARIIPNGMIGFVEGATVLGLVNVLFSVFAWFQFTYLFSGQALRTLEYEEFREYVRRGFGELLVASLLTMGLIISMRWLAHQETARERRIFNGLSSLMIILAGVMLFSAFTRMVVWENVDFYINTQLRIYVRYFILWLGILFAWLLLTMWVRRDRFAIGVLAAAIGFLVTINIVNPDAEVAAYNLRHKDDLATRYLYLLSDDAIPTLVAGLDSTTGEVKYRLREYLDWRLYEIATDPRRGNWQSAHASRDAAYRLLTDRKAAGDLDAEAISSLYVHNKSAR